MTSRHEKAAGGISGYSINLDMQKDITPRRSNAMNDSTVRETIKAQVESDPDVAYTLMRAGGKADTNIDMIVGYCKEFGIVCNVIEPDDDIETAAAIYAASARGEQL